MSARPFAAILSAAVYARLHDEGRDISEVTTVLEERQELISSIAKENPEALIKKYEKAEDRFRFLK